jgi:hypothetical protein
MYRLSPLVVLSIFAMGAGPCDLMQPPGEDETGDSGLECQEEMCRNSLSVEVIRADNEAFFDGVYDFEITVSDGTQYSLECYFAGYGASFDCSYGDSTMLGAVMESGYQAIDLTLLDAPETATFTVMYNDFEIGVRAFTPEYDEVHPNGPECPPVCYQAEETMAVESW